MSKTIIEELQPDLLILITSDFHIQRAKILYDIVVKYPNVLFIPAQSGLSKEELLILKQHEANAIRSLEENNFLLY